MKTKLHFKIIGLIFFCLGFLQSYGQLYHAGTGGSWTAANWSSTGSAPYTSAWVSNSDVVFNVANSTITGTTTTVKSITANENVTVTATGTLNTGGTIATITVASGKTFAFAGQTLSTAAGTGFIKAGTGTLSLAGSAYPGGFTMNAGTLIVGGINAMGGGSASPLNINGGTLCAASTRTITAKYSIINIGGNFTFGNTTNNSNISFVDPVSLGAGTTKTITLGGTGIYTFNGIVSGSSSNLIVAATAAGTLTLTGANTYNGLTTVSGGTLRLNRVGGTTLPNGNNIVVNSGGTLTVSTPQQLNNITVDTGGTLILNAGLTYVGTAIINGTLQMGLGGSIGSAPAYGASSSLIYNTTFTQGLEWNAGASTSPVAGLGVPAAVTVQSGTLTFGTTAGTPGAISVLNTATLNVNENIFGNSLSNDGTITVATDKVVNINNAFVNTKTAADVVFNNGSSLVQNNSVANTGNITYKRNTSNLANDLDFVYLGSPVANQTLSGMWMTTANDTFYSFNTANAAGQDWLYAAPTDTMDAGKGYIARAVLGSTGWTTLGTKYAVNFMGKPNNGDIPFVMVNNSGLNIDNLMANPYPSALDLLAFSTDIDNKTKITGNYYFWTHNTAFTGGNYASGDYSIYNVNLVAGTGAGSPASTGGAAPDQYVDAGQGFFAEASATAGTVTFKNAHRVAGNNNAFYKTANTSVVQSDKIWLNLSNSNGAFKQQLLAYADDIRATNGFDPNFDAKTFDGNPTIDFYGVIPNTNYKLTIQSRNTSSFTNNDIVPLGFKSSIEGDFTIAIDRFDGKFADKTVYLHDYTLGIDYNLSEKPYTFNTKAGTYNYRFELRYKSYLTNPPETGVIIANDTQWFKVKSKIKNIKNIVVFDILGRKILDKTDLNTTEFIATGIRNEEPLIVRITLIDGTLVVKKI